MTVFLVRHGETDWQQTAGPEFRGHGNDFAPLTEQGRQEARDAAEKIQAGLSGDAVVLVTSPMTRAMETAALIGQALGSFPAVSIDLREWTPDKGLDWSMGPEVKAAYDDLRAHGGEWPAGEERGWEPLSAVRGRVMRALAPYRTAGTLVVVTHGVVIESLTGGLVKTGDVVEWDWSTPEVAPPPVAVRPSVARPPATEPPEAPAPQQLPRRRTPPPAPAAGIALLLLGLAWRAWRRRQARR